MAEWQVPPIQAKSISRLAYGMDARGQLISDVNGQSIRAVYDALRQTLADRGLPQESVQAAANAWIVALNESLPQESPFSESWIKGTMHNYSIEFFCFADDYARQIVGRDDASYLRNLINVILPAPLKEVRHALSLEQILNGGRILFQASLPLDLRVEEVSSNSALLEWHYTALLAQLSPDYRDELRDNMRDLVRALLQESPRILKGIPATLEEDHPAPEMMRFRLRWRHRPWLPQASILGLGASLLLLGMALAGLPWVAYFVLLPLLLGLGLDAYRFYRQRFAVQEQAIQDQMQLQYMQSIEMDTVYNSLRSSSVAHDQQVRNLTAVRDALLAISSSFDQQQVMHGLMTVMTDILHFDRALLLRHDPQRHVLSYGIYSHPALDTTDLHRLHLLRIDLTDEDGNLKPDPLVEAWMAGRSVMINDPSAVVRSSLNWLLAMLEFNTFYSVPLLLGGTMQGVILVDNHFSRRKITPDDHHLIDSLAINMAITMENARLYHLQDAQLQKTLADMRLMEQVDSELAHTLELDLVLELLMDWALRATGARLALIYLVNELDNTCFIAANYGCAPEDLPGGQLGYIMPLEEAGIPGQAALTRRVQVVNDLSRHANHLVVLLDITAQVSVPILRQEQVVGVMTIENHLPEGFTPEHVNFVTRLATQAGVALENARLYTATQQEREKLIAVLRTTQDAVIVLDLEERLVLINEAARRIFRLSEPSDAYIGKPFRDIFPMPALLNLASHAGETLSSEIEWEDKSYTASRVHVPQVGYTLLLHDITLFKELDRLKNELVSTVSHDLKNPLANMKGYVELIMMTQALNEKGARYIGAVQRAIDNMKQLIDDLLDMARMDSGLNLQLEPIQIQRIVEAGIEEIKIRAEEKTLQVVVDVPADLPIVVGEERRLRQIFNNLISNAVKYTPQGGRVDIIGGEEAGVVKVMVRDTGVGIAPEDLGRIWERFERLRNLRTADVEGTGLGLAIVKRLVEAHGGEVGVDSVPDVGSTFWFTVPQLRKPSATQEIPLSTEVASSTDVPDTGPLPDTDELPAEDGRVDTDYLSGTAQAGDTDQLADE